MKVRDNTRPRANRIFTDRTEPRKAFWDAYERYKTRLRKEGEIFVLTYYGIGGIGKSRLLKQLQMEMDDKIDKPVKVYFDFAFKQDSLSFLDAIRNHLAKDYGYSFPLYDLGRYVYAKKTGDNAELEAMTSFVDNSPFLQFLLKVLSFIPVVSIVSQLVELADKGVLLANKTIRKVVDNHKPELVEIEKKSTGELYEYLTSLFAKDLADNQRDKDEPLVILLDTYEKLVNEMVSVGEPLENDVWIRGVEGLVQNIPNTMWVIAGREKLKWERFDSEWAEAMEQHVLGNISKEDCEHFFKNAGITDKALMDGLYELTDGVPIYLDLCVDRYTLLLEQGEVPAIEDFGKDVNTLVERFVRYMDDSLKNVVYILACLEQWDDEMAVEVINRIMNTNCNTQYEKVKNLSFILSQEDGLFTIHQTVNEILLKNCQEWIRKGTIKEAYDFCRGRHKETNAITTENARNFQQMLKFGIQNWETEGEIEKLYKEHEKTFEKYYHWGQYNRLDAIFDAAWEYIKSKNIPGEFLYLRRECAYLLKEKGLVERARILAEETYEKSKAVLGDCHPDTLEVAEVLVGILVRFGKYTESERLTKEIYEKRRVLLGEGHVDTLIATSNMAGALAKRGNYKEAEILAREVYGKLRDIQGENHEETLYAAGNLAGVLRSMGRFEEAKAILEDTYHRMKENYGEDYPGTLNVEEGLAFVLLVMGKYREAETLQRGIFEKRRELLGENHEETLAGAIVLANSLEHMGRYEEAEVLKRTVYEKRKALFGADYPSTLLAERNLARVLDRLGRYEEAEVLQREVYEKSKLSGESILETLSHAGVLANILRMLERYEEAEQLCKEIYEKRKEILGEDSPATLTAAGNLAVVWGEMGKTEQAVEMKRYVYKKNNVLFGEDYPGTLTVEANLAMSLADMEEYEEAEALTRDVYDKRKRLFGEDNPATVLIAENLAYILKETEAYEEAEALLREVLEKRRMIMGENHPRTLGAAENLADILEEQEEFEQAEILWREIFERKKELNGENDFDTLIAMGNLALMLGYQGKYQEEEALEKEVYARRKETLGAEDVETIVAAENLMLTLRELGKDLEADELKELYGLEE